MADDPNVGHVWIERGSIIVDNFLGNMRVRKSHTPTEAIIVERADIGDLADAIAAYRRQVPE